MAIITLKCPSCGAPIQMPAGRNMCYCEFCGAPVEKEMSSSEYSSMKKGNEFTDAVRAAVQCIRNKDYITALEYADKASDLDSTDPAPLLVKYVALLDKDFKKASSFAAIARSMPKASVALPKEDYTELLRTYVSNYLSERDRDFKRVYVTYRKVKPADIENVRLYEIRKRIEPYFTDPELKEAFMSGCSEFLEECRKDVESIRGGMTQSNWDAVSDIRNERLFFAAGTVFVDPSFAKLASQFLDAYKTILGQKWEKSFKGGEVSGSKDQVNTYRYEADSLLSWMKTVR